jgi:hypothetical protein
MLINEVVLCHDNAEPHMAAVAIEVIWKLKFELLPHLANSLHFIPSDYHIFGPPRGALCWHWFAEDEEVKHALHNIQPKAFFTGGIQELMDQSNECVEKVGDSIEKWQYILCYVPFIE